MPHAVAMPSLLSEDNGPTLLSERHPLELPSHLRQSREKLNGNGRRISYSSGRTSMAEDTNHTSNGGGETAINVSKAQANGEVNARESFGSTNGNRSSDSWDKISDRGGRPVDENGHVQSKLLYEGKNGFVGKAKPQLPVRNEPDPTKRDAARGDGREDGFKEHQSPARSRASSSHAPAKSSEDVERMKSPDEEQPGREPTGHFIDNRVPVPIPSNALSTGPLAYQTSLVPASPIPLADPPARPQTASPHRFSSPPNYTPPASATATSSGAAAHPGATQLKHRHTLQVPKLEPGRNARTSEDAVNGRFSPTSMTSAAVRRGSLSLNRRNTQSVHSTIPIEEVLPDGDAIRWADAVRQKRASKRKRKDEEDDDRVVVGTKVDQNHVNWVTAYNMLTGIRFTVSRTNAKLDRPLTDADFGAKHKFSFDM